MFSLAVKECMIYDCVYHPATYERGKGNPAFFKLLVTTALEGIERQFKGVKLHECMYKFKPKTYDSHKI